MVSAGPVIVTTPGFGTSSAAPWERARSEGLDLRRSRRPGPLSGDALADELPDAVGVIVGVDRIDAGVMDAAPGLRVIGKHGVGLDGIDVAAAEERGIRVVWTPGANSSAVADFAVALLLAGARRVVDADASLRRGEWEVFSGVALETATVGLLGFGNIGRAVARRLVGFGCRVVAYDPFVGDEVLAQAGVRRLELDDLLACSDIVSLHLPYRSGEAPLLDAGRLALLAAHAGIVNTARGGLIDDAALATALREGRLGFAALDAFASEPLSADSPLRTAPRTVLTPHAAAFTPLANERAGIAVVQDVARVLRGEEPLLPAPSSR